jgi:hypothetical protein
VVCSILVFSRDFVVDQHKCGSIAVQVASTPNQRVRDSLFQSRIKIDCLWACLANKYDFKTVRESLRRLSTLDLEFYDASRFLETFRCIDFRAAILQHIDFLCRDETRGIDQIQLDWDHLRYCIQEIYFLFENFSPLRRQLCAIQATPVRHCCGSIPSLLNTSTNFVSFTPVFCYRTEDC